MLAVASRATSRRGTGGKPSSLTQMASESQSNPSERVFGDANDIPYKDQRDSDMIPK
jgi:hypothetical protein